MDTVLLEIANQIDYRLFYDTADLDTTRITLKVDRQPFTELLTRIFQGTDLTYSIDRHHEVFIVRGEAIATGLPPGFFDRTVPEKEAVATNGASNDTIRDYLEEAGKKPVATIENKLFVIGDRIPGPPPRGIANLVGYTRDAKTGEPIVGASIYIDNPRIGTFSDRYGYFSLSLPKGRHVLNIQSIGMHDTRRLIMVYGDGKLNIDLVTQIMTLKKVIVSAEKVSNVKRTEMGVQKLDIKTIKQVPVVFGEADIMRVVTTLPGVKTVGESSTGLNVRGGSADQNLVLFNDATIYNTAHFFGMFSVFNPEVVKDVELYKSSVPARFGGRLSSVLDISSREGNKK
ncbi:MAG TPA: carboxypeptidase-like regulatory domain-containing protein, partial [Puia sp.]|nr:carboxypeptidase-like regulatory domain-containing protein [Puia sp.]